MPERLAQTRCEHMGTKSARRTIDRFQQRAHLASSSIVLFPSQLPFLVAYVPTYGFVRNKVIGSAAAQKKIDCTAEALVHRTVVKQLYITLQSFSINGRLQKILVFPHGAFDILHAIVQIRGP